MTMQTFKLYMTVGVGSYNHGEIALNQFKPRDEDNDNLLCKRFLREVYVEADVPAFDLVTLEVEALENAVQREKADSQVRVNLLLERISKLKAIGHDAN